MENNLNVFLKNADGESFPIKEFPFTIGKFEQFCNYVINEDKVAPIHCQITLDDGVFTLTEMNTNIGVEVGDTLLEGGASAQLNEGDVIRIGDVTLEFNISDKLISEAEFDEINGLYKSLLNQDNSEDVGTIVASLADMLCSKIQMVISSAEEIEQSEESDIKSVVFERIRPMFSEELTLKMKPGESTVTEAIDTNKVTSELEKEEGKGGQTDLNATLEEPEIKRENLNERKVKVDRSRVKRSTRSSREERQREYRSNTLPPRRPLEKTTQLHPQEEQALVLMEVRPPHAMITVRDTPFKIGKSSDLCDYVLDRRGISRHHATILKDERNKRYLVKDNNATNGTFVNEYRIIGNEAIISEGDIVSFYEHEFKVIKS